MTLSKLKPVLAFTLAVVSVAASAQTIKVELTGMQEVPAISTAATGSGTIMIAPDMSVSGSVTTMGVEGTMAHIHTAAAGQNGPVVVPMTKTADNVWSIPAGTKLTESQYQAYKNGNLYINVHSASNKSGEIRAQLQP